MEKVEILKELFKQREGLNKLINEILAEEEDILLEEEMVCFQCDIESIVSKAALVLGHSYQNFTNKKLRTKEIAKHKKFCWFYLKNHTSYTYAEISEEFGLHYSTVITGVKNLSGELEFYPETETEYLKFENLLVNNLY